MSNCIRIIDLFMYLYLFAFSKNDILHRFFFKVGIYFRQKMSWMNATKNMTNIIISSADWNDEITTKQQQKNATNIQKNIFAFKYRLLRDLKGDPIYIVVPRFLLSDSHAKQPVVAFFCVFVFVYCKKSHTHTQKKQTDIIYIYIERRLKYITTKSEILESGMKWILSI